jgi:hypothetical protein
MAIFFFKIPQKKTFDGFATVFFSRQPAKFRQKKKTLVPTMYHGKKNHDDLVHVNAERVGALQELGLHFASWGPFFCKAQLLMLYPTCNEPGPSFSLLPLRTKARILCLDSL